jgi:hypothetical protein
MHTISTPWGPSQNATPYGEGITFHSTAGHGGFFVAASIESQIPEYLRAAYVRGTRGWYEEDCDAAIVVVCFPERFTPEQVCEAKASLRAWHPNEYERFYGVTLQPGESFKRDQETFHKAHANDYLVVTAWGSWHKQVGAGFVAVRARIGGRSDNEDAKEGFFLVPESEYQTRGGLPFVVDPSKHPQIEAIQ